MREDRQHIVVTGARANNLKGWTCASRWAC